MISSKSRLLVPRGLDIVLQGLSRAILESNPQNVTEFAAFYFEELTVFREDNASLDIKNLIKQFHQTIGTNIWKILSLKKAKIGNIFRKPLGTMGSGTVFVNYDSNHFQYALPLGNYSELEENWIS